MIIIVNVDVKSERVNDFLESTRKAQSDSLKESGCSVYTLLQDISDPTKFVLMEQYNDMEAFELHKTTKHFQEWRNDVYEMMNTPRVSSKYIEK